MKKHLHLTILFIASTICSGCYPGIKGRVVDAVTGNPLEGTVVLAQWTTTGGLPGMSYHKLYAIKETETDKDGVFYMSGVYNPFVDQPELVVYKKGYVPWRNDMNFKDMIKYDKNAWENNMTYRLEYLKEGFSKRRIDVFVSTGLIGIGGETPKFTEVMSEIGNESRKERNW